MKKPFFQKNVFRDMLERDYTVYLVALFGTILLEVTCFLLQKAGWNAKIDFPIQLFSFTLIGRIFAEIGPFIIVWRLLAPYNSAEGRDIFYSLPATRRSVFGSATAIAFGYLAVFLIVETAVMAILFKCSRFITVEAGYFPTKIVMLAVSFLFWYGVAMICFSLSSGGIWYGVFSVFWMIWILRTAELAEGLPIWRYLEKSGIVVDEVSYYVIPYQDIGGEKFTQYLSVTRWARIRTGENWSQSHIVKDIGTFFWNVIPGLIVVALIVAVLGYIAFCLRKAESVEGKCKSTVMHVALQGAAVLLFFLIVSNWRLPMIQDAMYLDNVWAGLSVPLHYASSYNTDRAEYISALTLGLYLIVPALLIWEGLYQKSISKIWKAWKGMLCAAILVGGVFLYVLA